MRRIFWLIPWLFLGVAHAQVGAGPGGIVSQGGPIIPGHIVVWGQNNVINDGGNPAGTGTVTSVGASFSNAPFTTSGGPITNAGTITFTPSGTSGGVIYFNAANSLASSGALSANNPILGGGAGNPPISGSRSGNTTTFATTSGPLISGNCAKFDISGNISDNGAPCGSGGTGGITQLTNDVIAGPGTGSQGSTVVGLQGRQIASTVPATHNPLQWSGTQWAPGTATGASAGTYTCPTITVDATGYITSIVSGSCTTGSGFILATGSSSTDSLGTGTGVSDFLGVGG